MPLQNKADSLTTTTDFRFAIPTEKQIFLMIRSRGCEARLDAVLRSYFSVRWNALYLGRDSHNVSFCASDHSLVLSVPTFAFGVPLYLHQLIWSRLRQSELDRQDLDRWFPRRKP